MNELTLEQPNNTPFLRFEFIDEYGYGTVVEKTLPNYELADTQFDCVLQEFKYFLLACGFSPKSIDESVLVTE
jgi:hypothetical protein